MSINYEVSVGVANFFMEQCIGEHNGHMAAIPNNPVLMGLLNAHDACQQDKFAAFLREVADKLDRGQ